MKANIAPESFKNSSLKQNKTHHPISIRKSLFLGFFAIIVVLAVMLGMMLININKTKTFADKVIHTELPIYNLYLDINGQLINQKQLCINGYFLTMRPLKKTLFVLGQILPEPWRILTN